MNTRARRTISIDISDELARRVARHMSREGGLAPLVEKALEAWVEREDARLQPVVMPSPVLPGRLG